MIEAYKQFVQSQRAAGQPDDAIKLALSGAGTPADVMAQLFTPTMPSIPTMPTLPTPTLGLGLGAGLGVGVGPSHDSQPVDAATLRSVAGAISGVADKRRTIPDGEHLVRIDSVAVKDTHYGIKFFVEFEIVDSTNPTLRAGQTFSFGRDAAPASSKAEESKKERSHRDIREWVTLAVTGVLGRTKYENTDLEWVISPSQPAKGLFMRARTKTVQGKNGPFVVYDWDLK